MPIARPHLVHLTARGRQQVIKVVQVWVGHAPVLATLLASAALAVSLVQLTAYRQAIRGQSISDVMNRSSQILMWAASDPDSFAFFERDLFGGRGGRRTLDELRAAPPATRMRVQLVCETLSDFFESTYDRRDAFEPREWAAWWDYMGEVYGESVVLREYLRLRDPWYNVDEALAESHPLRLARGR